MAEIRIENPVHLKEASFSVRDQDLMTQAAFLLAAGVWYRKLEEDPLILPTDDLEPLGLSGWHLSDANPSRLFDPGDPTFADFVNDRVLIDRDNFHSQLGKLIWNAYESRTSLALAKAVMKGMASPDALVRICALTSAFELFNFSFIEWVRKLTIFNFSESETTTSLLAMLQSRVFGFAINAANVPPKSGASKAIAKPGVVLIHGTNFPPNRPVWSVPGTGPLFNHIAGFRNDIYDAQDYYRWEGGYSMYAREVASLNLDDWIQRRKLGGIDAVTHSHGGNVLLAATNRGTNFNKVVLLSCPVRWREY